MAKIDKALNWIENNLNDDNFLIFKDNGKKGEKPVLQNHVWKDSDESLALVLGPDGKMTLPDFPVASAEVQGYLYSAWTGMANTFRKMAEKGPDLSPDGKIIDREKLENQAKKLEEYAKILKKNFNNKFWNDDEKFIVLALDKDGRQIPVVTSNGSQCLFTGIIDKDKAAKMESRIMDRNSLHAAYGIRTLSKKPPKKVLVYEKEDNSPVLRDFNGKEPPGYNEISYHNGSVWPHDTAVNAWGMSHENTAILTDEIIKAASQFDGRIPELFGGFGADETKNVQRYPGVCSPQAWSAASIPSLVMTSVGLKPTDKGIMFENPVLPSGIDYMQFHSFNCKGRLMDIVIKKNADSGKIDISAHLNDTEIKSIYEEKDGKPCYRINLPER